MSRPSGVRLAAEVRHQSVLIARDPGPLIGYTVMGLLLITATRPLCAALSHRGMGPGESGIDRATAGMAVMFSLFALKVGAAQLLNERTWRTGTGCEPARPASARSSSASPCRSLVAVALQQALLFGFAAVVFGLRPRACWWALAACGLAWSGCVLFLGVGASTLARSPAQLSAAGDVFALLTTVLGDALVPVVAARLDAQRRLCLARLLGARRPYRRRPAGHPVPTRRPRTRAPRSSGVAGQAAGIGARQNARQHPPDHLAPSRRQVRVSGLGLRGQD